MGHETRPNLANRGTNAPRLSTLNVAMYSMNNSLGIVGNAISVDKQKGEMKVLVAPGSNLMLVQENGGRYFLMNGYHRAWLFRARGVDMVPVVLQRVPQLMLPAGMMHPMMLAGPRPPTVDDFFSTQLATTVAVRSVMRAVKVTVEMMWIPRLL